MPIARASKPAPEPPTHDERDARERDEGPDDHQRRQPVAADRGRDERGDDRGRGDEERGVGGGGVVEGRRPDRLVGAKPIAPSAASWARSRFGRRTAPSRQRQTANSTIDPSANRMLVKRDRRQLGERRFHDDEVAGPEHHHEEHGDLGGAALRGGGRGSRGAGRLGDGRRGT